MTRLDTMLQWILNRCKNIASIITWLDMINTPIWTTEGNYQTGQSLTVPQLSQYIMVKVKIYSFEVPITVLRQSSNFYYGGSTLVSGDIHYTVGVSFTKNTDGTWKLMCYDLRHVSAGSHDAYTSAYGINEIVGLIPLWGGYRKGTIFNTLSHSFRLGVAA